MARRPFVKRLALIICCLLGGIVLLLAAGAAYLYTLSDEDRQGLASYLIEKGTGLTLAIEGELSLDISLHPSLAITDFSLSGGEDGAGLEVSNVERLELTVDLRRLLDRVFHVERLRIVGADVQVAGTAQEPPKRGAPRSRFSLTPLISDAELAECRLVYRNAAGKSGTTLEMDSLTLKKQDDDESLALLGTGVVNGFPLQVGGRLGPVREFLRPSKPYPVELHVAGARAEATVKGTVENPASGKGLDLNLTLRSKEVAKLLRLANNDWPDIGSLEAVGHLQGDRSRPRLEGFSAKIRGEGARIDLEGRVENLVQMVGVDLRFDAQVERVARFHPLYEGKIPLSGRVAAKGRITDEGGTLGVSDLKGSLHGDLLTAEVSGTIGDLRASGPLPIAKLDLSASAQTPDLSAWSKPVGHDLPALGPVTAAAKIRDHQGALQFSDVAIRAGRGDPAQVTIDGRVEKLFLKPRFSVSGVALHFGGKAGALSDLFVSPQVARAPEGRVQASGDLTDEDGSLGIEGAQLQVGDEETGYLRVTGDLDDLENLREANLVVEIRLADLTAIAPLLNRELPSLGPVNGTAEIKDQDGTFGAEKIDLRIGSRETTWIRLAGRVGDLRAQKGIDLQGEVAAGNLTDIGSLVGRELPSMGPVQAAGRILDRNGSLAAENIEVQVGPPDGDRVVLKGQLDDIRTLAGLELDAEIALADLDLIAALTGRELPDLGPVRGTLRVVKRNGSSAATDIDVHVGDRGTVWLALTGQIDDLQNLKGVAIGAEAGAAGLPLLEPLIGRKLPDIGPVTATARLVDADGSLGVEDLRAEAGRKDDFELLVTGGFDDIRALDKLDFDVQLRAKHLSGLSEAFDVPLPGGSPVDLKAHFTGSDEQGRLVRMDLNIGRTQITGDCSYVMTEEKPRITAELKSPLVYAPDLLLKRPAGMEGRAPEAKSTDAPKPPQRKEWLFDPAPLPFDKLHAVNGRFTLAIERLETSIVAFDAIADELTLEDGRLEFRSLRRIAGGGELGGKLIVDAGATSPEISVDFTASDWNAGALQAPFTENPYVEGQIDGHIELRATGRSLRELAANLDGVVAIVFGGGTLRGFAINKLAANMITQMFGQDDPDKTPLNCAVDHLEVENGLATAKVLLIDSDVSTIVGTGTIDLRNEEVDLLFTPKPKIPKLVRIKTPVSIRGSLVDPTVTVESGRSFLKQGVMAIGLGLLNPFAAIIPFVSPGSLDHHPCAEFLEKKEDGGAPPSDEKR